MKNKVRIFSKCICSLVNLISDTKIYGLVMSRLQSSIYLYLYCTCALVPISTNVIAYTRNTLAFRTLFSTLFRTPYTDTRIQRPRPFVVSPALLSQLLHHTKYILFHIIHINLTHHQQPCKCNNNKCSAIIKLC